ncbi:MAG: hypothetical protein JWN24_1216 [Phycisphaerales bacterium]|nr:hypothetical protein [Phycisphaerales bacterium]
MKYVLEYAGLQEPPPSFWRSEAGLELAALTLIVTFLLSYFALLTAAILAVDFMLLRVI